MNWEGHSSTQSAPLPSALAVLATFDIVHRIIVSSPFPYVPAVLFAEMMMKQRRIQQMNKKI